VSWVGSDEDVELETVSILERYYRTRAAARKMQRQLPTPEIQWGLFARLRALLCNTLVGKLVVDCIGAVDGEVTPFESVPAAETVPEIPATALVDCTESEGYPDTATTGRELVPEPESLALPAWKAAVCTEEDCIGSDDEPETITGSGPYPTGELLPECVAEDCDTIAGP
jgi:hypothetical protein